MCDTSKKGDNVKKLFATADTVSSARVQRLEGITFIGYGQADGRGTILMSGKLYSTVITNCDFIGLLANSDANGREHILVKNTSLITDCRFLGCNGASIGYNALGGGADAVLEIENCTFGWLYAPNNQSAAINAYITNSKIATRGCLFEHIFGGGNKNNRETGLVIGAINGNLPEIRDCVFRDIEHTDGTGTAYAVQPLITNGKGTTKLYDCTFENCRMISAFDGAALVAAASATNCVFRNCLVDVGATGKTGEAALLKMGSNGEVQGCVVENCVVTNRSSGLTAAISGFLSYGSTFTTNVVAAVGGGNASLATGAYDFAPCRIEANTVRTDGGANAALIDGIRDETVNVDPRARLNSGASVVGNAVSGGTAISAILRNTGRFRLVNSTVALNTVVGAADAVATTFYSEATFFLSWSMVYNNVAPIELYGTSKSNNAIAAQRFANSSIIWRDDALGDYTPLVGVYTGTYASGTLVGQVGLHVFNSCVKGVDESHELYMKHPYGELAISAASLESHDLWNDDPMIDPTMFRTDDGRAYFLMNKKSVYRKRTGMYPLLTNSKDDQTSYKSNKPAGNLVFFNEHGKYYVLGTADVYNSVNNSFYNMVRTGNDYSNELRGDETPYPDMLGNPRVEGAVVLGPVQQFYSKPSGLLLQVR